MVNVGYVTGTTGPEYDLVGGAIADVVREVAGDPYRAVTGKDGLFDLWDTMTEYVQETHLCPEFERREPGTEYRG
jgi:hypothetical protein